METTGFVRYSKITGASIIAPQGAISPKSIGKGYIETDLTELPGPMKRHISDFMNPGEWKGIVDTPFDLKDDAFDGEIRPVKNGHLYIFLTDDVMDEDASGSWYFLSSVAGVR